MESNLFRDEALQAKRDAWIGRVQISQALPAKLVAFVGVVLLAAHRFLYCSWSLYSARECNRYPPAPRRPSQSDEQRGGHRCVEHGRRGPEGQKGSAPICD